MAVSVFLRLMAGGLLAPAMAAAGQVSGEFGALCVGVVAPLLIEQLTRQAPAALAASPGVVAGSGSSMPGAVDPQAVPGGVPEPAPSRGQWRDGNR
jgi:hypothetical protein